MSINAEQASEMQARVNAHKTLHSERATKTATTVGVKAERASGAATGQAKIKNVAAIEIGIDPGTNTGVAVRYCGTWHTIATMTIIEAIDLVRGWTLEEETILVRFEDARLRTWFGKSGPEKWKGAGSIMRDCAIWEETLTALGIPFEKVPPKEVKETTAAQFQKLTGWKTRTSIHAREAAWLVLPFLKTKNI
jgi:hypothetical protein